MQSPNIYMVESVGAVNRSQGSEEHEGGPPSVEQGPDSVQAPVNCSISRSKAGDQSGSHLKLAEKVAKLMEGLDALGDLPNPGIPRLRLRVMEDSDTGPIVLMNCSKEHARVVCETLSAKLGPEQKIETNSSESTKRQQHHFPYHGGNLLASFLKKAFSSRGRRKSRQPKDGGSVGSTPGDTRCFDSGMFDTSSSNRGNAFHGKDCVSSTRGQDSTREADVRASRAALERGLAKLQHISHLPTVLERYQDDEGATSDERRVRSANASPARGHMVDESPALQPVSGYMAQFLATPARNLGRAKSLGRRQSRVDDESGVGRGKGRLFGFVSPGRSKPQHRFEDRLGHEGNLAGEVRSGATRSKGGFFSLSSPARKNNKRTGQNAGADRPFQDREWWSGIVGSPGGRGRGFGGAASCEQSWGFLGGIGSPVRENRKCGNGWGPVYSFTDVVTESGDDDTEDNIQEPTSPEVTCIGRVKAKAPRCPHLAQAAAAKALNHAWSASVTQTMDKRNNRVHGSAPHSAPVLLQASAVAKVSDAEPKKSRWKSILGLYRAKASSLQGDGNMKNGVGLSRCRKTSLGRFGGHAPAADTEVDVKGMPQTQIKCESCGNLKPCGCATCTGGHRFINRQARDSIQAWLADAVEGEDLENSVLWTDNLQQSKSDEVPSQNVDPVGEKTQQCLWQRRQFCKPKPLDLGFNIQVC